jgi:hypothetical protein
MNITTAPRNKDSVWLLDDGQVIGALTLHRVQPADKRDSNPCERREYYAQGISLLADGDSFSATIRYAGIAAAGALRHVATDPDLPTKERTQ